MPGYWLCKSEPDVYSIDDLRRDKVTGWEGVRNYQARNFMRDGMQPGDRVLVYHSNAEPTGVAGIAAVAGAAKADPTQFDPRSEYHDPKSTREEPRWLMRELRFVERFGRVVTLEELKSCKALHAMAALQKGSRLSVTPVTKAEFDAVLRMAKGLPATPAAASRK
jgi:predicted RNA-binding protein with PUA-like domain